MDWYHRLSVQLQIAIMVCLVAVGVLIGRFLATPSISSEERSQIVGTAQAQIVQTMIDAQVHFNKATEESLFQQINSSLNP